jgi:hypothetical protein
MSQKKGKGEAGKGLVRGKYWGARSGACEARLGEFPRVTKTSQSQSQPWEHSQTVPHLPRHTLYSLCAFPFFFSLPLTVLLSTGT